MQLKTPREQKSEKTRQKLLNAVKDMLSSYDFRYLTVRNICELSHVSYGSFYHHFSSKENLLLIYTEQLLIQNLENNPFPEWLHPDDYIKRILWKVAIMGQFCEKTGRDLIGYVLKNSTQSLFEDTMTPVIRPELDRAHMENDLNESRADGPDGLLLEMSILCDGTLMWWSCHAERQEPVYTHLLPLCFNFLFSYSSGSYQARDIPRQKLENYPQFPDAIQITGL